MADSSTLFDNNATTQRSISAGYGLQTFTNSATDTSYSLGIGDSDDYYRVQVSRSSNLVLTLTGLSGNADLQFLDSSGNPATGQLGTSTNPGGLAESIITDVLSAGTYYIRVSTTDTSSTINYTLGVNSIAISRSDLVWRSASSGGNGIWRMNNNQIAGVDSAGPNLADPSWTIVDVADFNSDGQDDYIWRNTTYGYTGAWLMDANGAVRSTVALPQVDPSWELVKVIDFNNDGNLDLLWRQASQGATGIWLMNGGAISTTIGLPQMTAPWRLETAADLNRDGSVDLVWRNTSNGGNGVWFMNGVAYASAGSLTAETDINWKIEDTGDFNGDGNLDLLWRNSTTGNNRVWYMNGTTSLSTAAVPAVNSSWSIGGVIKSPGYVDLAGNTLPSAFDIGFVDNGTANNAAEYSDRIGTISDQNDYYKFSLQNSSTIAISLAGLQANADLWLIRDNNNNGVIDDTAPSDIIVRSETSGAANEFISGQILSAGTYFIRVRSAEPSASTVTPYSLAIAATQAPPIDLTATTISLSRTSTDLTQSTQRTISITYSVQYTDPSPPQAGRTFNVGLYLSRDAVINTADLRLDLNGDGVLDDNDFVTFTNVQPGTFTRTINVTLPQNSDLWWGGNQTYYIGVLADPNNTTVETFENNNYRAAGIAITGTVRPDVVGGGFDIVQATGTPGSAITLRGTVTNQGTVVTTPTGLRFYATFYLSNDDIYDGSDYTFPTTTAAFAPIAAGASVNFISTTGQTPNVPDAQQPAVYFTNTALALPSAGAWSGWQGNGRYYILMRLDLFGDIQESSGGKENNFNYGRTVPQVFNSYIGTNVYRDYDFIDVTGL
ncbi:MAG TPA: pre-peptidase C-terminal domain-containing protein [Microcoleaceae cyanobacterium]|jgi:hypothetical protein